MAPSAAKRSRHALTVAASNPVSEPRSASVTVPSMRESRNASRGFKGNERMSCPATGRGVRRAGSATFRALVKENAPLLLYQTQMTGTTPGIGAHGRSERPMHQRPVGGQRADSLGERVSDALAERVLAGL